MMCSRDGVCSATSSATGFAGTSVPRRRKPSATTRTFASQSRSRATMAPAPYPLNSGMTIAPTLAQARNTAHRLRDHRQAEAHAVTRADAELAQPVGAARRLGGQLEVAPHALAAVVALPHDGVPARLSSRPPVRGVAGQVQPSAGPPPREREALAGVAHARGTLLPADADVVDGRRPEPLRVARAPRR